MPAVCCLGSEQRVAWPVAGGRRHGWQHSPLLVGAAGQFTESAKGEIKFPEISTAILEKVCQYFYYKLRYQNS
jgi:hypothetical protein